MIKDIFGIFKYLFYIAGLQGSVFLLVLFLATPFSVTIIAPLITLIGFVIFFNCPRIVASIAKKEKWSKYLDYLFDNPLFAVSLFVILSLIAWLFIRNIRALAVTGYLLILICSPLNVFNKQKEFDNLIKKTEEKNNIFGLMKYLFYMCASFLTCAFVLLASLMIVRLEYETPEDFLFLDIAMLTLFLVLLFSFIFSIVITLKAKKENWSKYLNFFFNKPLYTTLLYISFLIFTFISVMELFLPFFVPMATVIYLTVIISGIVEKIKMKRNTK